MAMQGRAARRTRIGPPRLLPLLIAVASVALAVRVGAVGEDLASLSLGPVRVAEARAETAPGHAAIPLSTAAGGSAPAAPAEPVPDAAPAAPPADPADATAEAGAPASPLTASEIEVLQQLADRRDRLADRERELADRSVLLEAAEARIDEKVAELKELRATLEGLIRAYEEQEDAKIRSLVKIYEAMKPREAARIFEELEIETLLMVADRMKERSLAPIMANLDPAKAKEITVELAQLRKLPEDVASSEPAER